MVSAGRAPRRCSQHQWAAGSNHCSCSRMAVSVALCGLLLLVVSVHGSSRFMGPQTLDVTPSHSTQFTASKPHQAAQPSQATRALLQQQQQTADNSSSSNSNITAGSSNGTVTLAGNQTSSLDLSAGLGQPSNSSPDAANSTSIAPDNSTAAPETDTMAATSFSPQPPPTATDLLGQPPPLDSTLDLAQRQQQSAGGGGKRAAPPSPARGSGQSSSVVTRIRDAANMLLDDDGIGAPPYLQGGCPAAPTRLPTSISSQEALKSCPMVVLNLVEGRNDITGSACSGIIIQNNKPEVIRGWQLVWRQAARNSPFDVEEAYGAELVSGEGGVLSSPLRVMNSAEASNISAAGGTASFSLVLNPRLPSDGNASLSTQQQQQGAMLSNNQLSLAAAAAKDANLGWTAVFVNGKTCSRIPARSLLLEDCSTVTYGELPSFTAAPQIKCTSVFCCGDFQDTDPVLPAANITAANNNNIRPGAPADIQPSRDIPVSSSVPRAPPPRAAPPSGSNPGLEAAAAAAAALANNLTRNYPSVPQQVSDALNDLTNGILALLSPPPPVDNPPAALPASPPPPPPLAPTTGAQAPATQAPGSPLGQTAGSLTSATTPPPPPVVVEEDSQSVPLVAVVVPTVAGALLLAAILAAVWAVRLRREIIRHVSRDQQSLEADAAAVLGPKTSAEPATSDSGTSGNSPSGDHSPPHNAAPHQRTNPGHDDDPGAPGVCAAPSTYTSHNSDADSSGGLPAACTAAVTWGSPLQQQHQDHYQQGSHDSVSSPPGSAPQTAEGAIYYRGSDPSKAYGQQVWDTTLPTSAVWADSRSTTQDAILIAQLPTAALLTQQSDLLPPQYSSQGSARSCHSCGSHGDHCQQQLPPKSTLASTSNALPVGVAAPSRTGSVQSSVSAMQTWRAAPLTPGQTQAGERGSVRVAGLVPGSRQSSLQSSHPPSTTGAAHTVVSVHAGRLEAGVGASHAWADQHAAQHNTLTSFPSNGSPPQTAPSPSGRPPLHTAASGRFNRSPATGSTHAAQPPAAGLLDHLPQSGATLAQHNHSRSGQGFPATQQDSMAGSPGRPLPGACHRLSQERDPVWGVPLASLLQAGIVLHEDGGGGGDDSTPTHGMSPAQRLDPWLLQHPHDSPAQHQLLHPQGYAQAAGTVSGEGYVLRAASEPLGPSQAPSYMQEAALAGTPLRNTYEQCLSPPRCAPCLHPQAAISHAPSGSDSCERVQVAAAELHQREGILQKPQAALLHHSASTTAMEEEHEYLQDSLQTAEVIFHDTIAGAYTSGPSGSGASRLQAVQQRPGEVVYTAEYVEQQQGQPLHHAGAGAGASAGSLSTVRSEPVGAPGAAQSLQRVSSGSLQRPHSAIVGGSSTAAPGSSGVGAVGSPQPATAVGLAASGGGSTKALGGVGVALNFARDVVLLRKIGSGAFGTVYAAVWKAAPAGVHALVHDDQQWQTPGGDLTVAVKVVPLMIDSASYSARTLDSLKQEVQVLSRVSHPNVVRFLGACLAPPNVCIVEQLAEGGSLHMALHGNRKRAAAPSTSHTISSAVADMLREGQRDGGLAYRQVLRLGAEIAGAMAYLHSLHVVHRDLKAPNVLLDAQGRALVADFGIAKFRDGRTFLSTKNVHAGTPCYMAPEQFEGRPVSEKVDQFAFGVLLWEMLTGQLPWSDLDHPMQIIFMVGVQGERLSIPADCPADLSTLIRQCWHDDPASRPPFEVLEGRLTAMLDATAVN